MIRIVLCVLVVISVPLLCFAQDSPGGFFQKGFVERNQKGSVTGALSQGSSSPSHADSSKKQKSPSQMFDGISVVPEKSDGGSDGSQKASADGRDAGIVPEVSRGDKIYSIGLLVNGVDKDHLMKHAQTAVDVAAKHDLIISQIAAVGLIQPGKKNVVNAAPLFNSPLAFSVIALDGHFFPLLKMPDDFPVTRSPTWVINTAKGSILIEGLENIDKMINQYGEYVDKDFASMMAEEVEVKGPERVEIVGIEEK